MNGLTDLNRGFPMARAFVSLALICLFQGSALADEKPTVYHITTTAFQFDPSQNTYSFEVRFVASPCPEVNYNIAFNVAGVKDTDEAIAKVQPQIDKIAADLAKDQEKRCH
jgi:hypothetical protein